MGGDGGSIPKRRELVKQTQRQETLDKDVERELKWKRCALTQETLRYPIVACKLGKFYNKESILEFLIDRAKFGDISGLNHIRSLKDVRDIALPVDKNFICPITAIEANGIHKFVFIWTCRCVYSEKAMKELNQFSECLVCNTPYEVHQRLHLHPEDADLQAMKDNLPLLNKKTSKRSIKHCDNSNTTGNASCSSTLHSKQAKLSTLTS